MNRQIWVTLLAMTVSTSLSALDIGTARIDITPASPIRLNGYGGRKKPSEGIAQRLHAKALAIGGENPAIIITADVIGVSQSITDAVRDRLASGHGIRPNRVSICATHTHTGPSITGILEDIFMEEIPAEQMQVINDFTRLLTDKLFQVAVEALKNRQPGRLDWGVGTVDFAINRRVLEKGHWKGFGENPNGPVDHSLPLIRATNTKGDVLALLVNYACHCTTLGGDFNRIHGDWAGRAAELIEQDHPAANALIAIGCGADANPKSRGQFASIEPHAKKLADEVRRLLSTKLTPLGPVSIARFETITLPFDSLPSKADWQAKANVGDRLSFYARKMLARLGRGEALKRHLDYQIQTWQFGEDLAMVFLPGEVVADYSRHLKEVFRPERLWLNAYANDLPCYIPSRRLYDEGGYEVDRNMWYYGHPTRLSKDTEELVVDEVIRQLPHRFYSAATLNQMPPPLEKSAALQSVRTRADMTVELVAAEPLIMDPVDIAWGADGRLWVVEMADYPLGVDDKGKSGGRVRFLEDTDHDGIYDRSTLFADGLNFPSSVMPWRNGVLITAAPDILFAEDTDSDGRADRIKKLFTGFGEGNQQHRVNGLQWGLDNRVHVANGDSDGEILSRRSRQRLNIRGHDFSIDPDSGELALESGRTQHGRCRDDDGNWFGVNNSWPGWHVALEQRYLARNPHISWPDVRSHLQNPPSAGPVFPSSRTLNRLNDFSRANRFTSACGSTIYRDDLLGVGYRGNYFVCEPVHNLVRREVLSPRGTTFGSAKPDDESGMEFFASTDSWSRPVSVRTGPDGALYVVDMYRFLIEHPQWVPADWQRKLEFRAGSDKGRIYRITPKDLSNLAPIKDISTQSLVGLVATLESPNGPLRDLAHQQLLWKNDPTSKAPLLDLAGNSKSIHARMHAFCILDGLGGLTPASLIRALNDPAPNVIRHAIRLAEPFQDREPSIREAFRRLSESPSTDPQVRKQLAYSLGQSGDRTAIQPLLTLALSSSPDDFLVQAALSSTAGQIRRIATVLLERDPPSVVSTAFYKGLVRTAAAAADKNGHDALHPLALLAARSTSGALRFLEASSDASLDTKTAALLLPRFAEARKAAFDSSETIARRAESLALLRFAPATERPGLENLTTLLTATVAPPIQSAATETVLHLYGRNGLSETFTRWNSIGPIARSAVLKRVQRRSDWSGAFLDWLAGNRVAVSTLSAAERIVWTTHQNPQIRERAGALFDSRISPDRQAVIDRYAENITTTGSRENGRLLFESACAVCHSDRENQPALGPNLAALSDYSSPILLAAVLDPNRAVEDKFLAYTATAKGDREITGLLLAESVAEIRLTDAAGQIHSISRQDLISLTSSGLSLMPEGFEDAIPPSAMSDLIAYLRSLASSRVLEANADGTFELGPPSVSIAQGGATISSDAILGISEKDRLHWTLRHLPAAQYEIAAESALATGYEGKAFHLEIGGIVADGIFETTGSLTRFRSRKFGNIRIPSDMRDVSVRFNHDLPGPVLSLRSISLIPLR
jgi:putative membrane-bound dehydrogenase-like protein